MALIDLNIGLVTSEDSGKLTIEIDDVLAQIQKRGINVVGHRIAQSDSEQTLVVLCDMPDRWRFADLAHRIELLCVALKQDAIAGRLYFGNSCAGFLLGPKAADWGGKFIEEYYIQP